MKSIIIRDKTDSYKHDDMLYLAELALTHYGGVRENIKGEEDGNSFEVLHTGNPHVGNYKIEIILKNKNQNGKY